MARDIDPTLLMARIERHAAKFKDRHHSEWPTVRDMARKFRVPQEAIQDAIECSDKLDLIVGIGTGGGWFEHESRGDYSAEWIGDE